MAWRPHGYADVSATAPRAFACCDRCGMLYNHKDLSFQYDWTGAQLTNLNLLVCRTCYDTPNEGLRPLKLPPDPMPILNPRPLRNALAEGNTPPEVLWDEPGLLYDDGVTEWE